DAAGEEREFLRVRMDMGVAVAGACGYVEIDRRRWLRCFGGGGSVVHDHSGCDGGKHHTASRQHWCSPWIMLLIIGVRTGRQARRLQRSSSAPGVVRPWCDREIIGRSEAREGRPSSGCIE